MPKENKTQYQELTQDDRLTRIEQKLQQLADAETARSLREAKYSGMAVGVISVFATLGGIFGSKVAEFFNHLSK